MSNEKTPTLELNKDSEARFSSKKMLTDNADKATKIRYTDRMSVEIIKDTDFYRKGQVINPHKVKGQALIDQKIGKKFVAKED